MVANALHAGACRCGGCQPGYLAQQLAEAGARATPRRQAVWDLLAAARAGLSVQELAAALAGQGAGQATVYRAVELCERLGLVRRTLRLDGRTVYAVVPPGHCHALICDRCGLVREFDTCSWNVVGELLSLKTGFAIASHYLEVHGVCPACQHHG
jgi:Fe2+ or Zn2+ uptake regulation protein